MANRMALIHPDMLDSLPDFYPKSCTIKEPSSVQSGSGHPTITYTAIGALTNLACRLAPSTGKEVKKSNQTYTVGSYTIVFPDYYVAITELMQAVIDEVDYDILNVAHDAEEESTRLLVEIVK